MGNTIESDIFGLPNKGLRTNRQCKIYTIEQAEKVRNAYFKHRISVTNLAKMCEVSECHVRRILKNKLLCPIR